MEEKKCKYCGKLFATNYPQKVYCTYHCQQRSRVQKTDPEGRITKICPICKKEFKVKLCRQTNRIHYCSDQCRNEAKCIQLHQKMERDKQKRKRKHAKTNINIIEAEKKARNLGKSYGQINAVQVRVVIPEEFRKRTVRNE